eukprot:TRINITY_DN26861_c0_g1_i1.p1 TRINITY_DN26861_c0_g1~~TRINITY_DN26861_c0_g1_i1.p1  ORF type:complete len:155 (-),score=16.38 TRINITY_DN26861_c0_g1_i1:241-705(-)
MALDRFKLLFTLSFITFLLVPSLNALKVDYCDKNYNYAVKVSGVEVSPDPVERGKLATFSILASTEEPISGGKLVIDVSYFGFHVHTETHDLCEETLCPIASSDFVLSHSQSLPGYTPPGTYTLKMTMSGESGKQLTCITFKFSIGFGSSVADI